MFYRGNQYTPAKKVEAVFDGKVLTYRGQTYQHRDNLLEAERRVVNKNLRYRGAQLHMAKQ